MIHLPSSAYGAGDSATINSYDALGDPTSASAYPSGVNSPADTTLYSYDGAQRLAGIENPDGTTETYNYQGRNLASTTDEME